MAYTFTSTMAGASADYIRYIYREQDNTWPLKTDRYRDSTYLDFALAPIDANFVKLTRGAYINVSSTLYPNWFTGYVIAEPELVPLGMGPGNVPKYCYKYRATADEYILSLKPVGIIQPFMNVSMGTILKTLIAKLVPNTFDVTNIADGPIVAQYAVDPNSKFVDITQDFCKSANFRFYGNNQFLYFLAQDNSAGSVTIDGTSKFFAPGSGGSGTFQFRPSAEPIINDAIVQGYLEPSDYVTEYFVGTGFDAAFNLTTGVYGIDTSVLIDEQFSGSSISNLWTIHDASNFLQLSNGYLNSLGGTSSGSYATNIQSVNPLPMDGRMRFTHGEFDFISGNGIIASCWTQAPNSSYTGCLYGLSVVGSTLSPIVSGALDSTQFFTIDFTKRYVIRTIVEFGKVGRSVQTFSYIDANGVRQTYGGSGQADTALWQTVVTEVNPNTGQVTQQAFFRNTSTLTGTSDNFATYIPLASDSLHATVTNITVSIPVNATLDLASMPAFTNMAFEDWSDSTHPTGWDGSHLCSQETTHPYSGTSALRLTYASTDQNRCTQPAKGLIQKNIKYNFFCQARLSPGFVTSGVSFNAQLLGTGLTDPGFSVAASTLNSSTYTLVQGQLTAPIGVTINDDTILQIFFQGGSPNPGDYILVDNCVVLSDWQAQIIGPNEIDAMDGLSPIATIVQGNTGADTFNSYSGAAQYNPGQAQLVFFKDSVSLTSNLPAANQVIRVSYRSASAAVGRAISSASIITEAAKWKDNGVRNIVRNDLNPYPRNSFECELAASAIVSESSFPHYEGTYQNYSEYFFQEPKGGAILQFSNFSGLAAVTAEEINQVETTMESSKPIERFIHKITFGKPDRVNQLLDSFDQERGSFQKAPTQYDVPPVDVKAVGTNYASDITKPLVSAWDDNNVYVDLNQSLPANGLNFEYRYSDDSWGSDAGRNLLTRTTAQTLTLPRSLRGRRIYARQVNNGNYMPYSEEITNGSILFGALSSVIDYNPDGDQSPIAKVQCVSGTQLTFSTVHLPSVNSSLAWTVSLRGTPGLVVTMHMTPSLTKAVTLTGYWQRVTLSNTSNGATNINCTFTLAATGTFYYTRNSLESGTSVETGYYKTTGTTLYGPSSRYSTLLSITFPNSTFSDIIDATTGPADVTIDKATYDYVWPGNAQSNSGQPTNLRLTITYKVIAGWTGAGVHVYAEDPDQSGTPNLNLSGNVPLDGSTQLGGSSWNLIDLKQQPDDGTHTVTITTGLPIPTAIVPIRVYLAAYSSTVDNKIIRANATTGTPTPSVVLTVNPPDVVQGNEFAKSVTNLQASASYGMDGTGHMVLFVDASWVNPDDSNFQQVYLILLRPPSARVGLQKAPPGTRTGQLQDNTPLQVLFSPPPGVENLVGELTAFPVLDENDTIYAISVNVDGQINSYIAGVTPEVPITLPAPPEGNAGMEKTQIGGSPSVSLEYGINADGVEYAWYQGSVDPPTDPTFMGYRIYLRPQVSPGAIDPSTGIAANDMNISSTDSTQTDFTTQHVPIRSDTPVYDMYFLAFDVSGQSNKLVPGVTQEIANLQPVPQTSGSIKAHRMDPGTLDATIGIVGGKLGVPDAALVISKFASGIRPVALMTTDATLPSSSYPAGTYGFNTTSRILKRVNSAGNAWELGVSGADIMVNSIVAGTVQSGSISTTDLNTTEIKVGGGGSKPGQFGVYNASNTLIGWVGTNGGNEGAWFKTISIGGTGYSSGIVKADSSGNVTIVGATLSLVTGTVTSSVNNYIDATYGTMALQCIDSSTFASIVTPRAFIIFDNARTHAVVQVIASGSGTTQSGTLIVLKPNTGASVTVSSSSTSVAGTDGGSNSFTLSTLGVNGVGTDGAWGIEGAGISVPAGGLILNSTTKIGNYTMNNADFAVYGDTTITFVTIKLPPSPAQGQIHLIDRVAGSNNLTLDGNGHNIRTVATALVTAQIIVQFVGSIWQF